MSNITYKKGNAAEPKEGVCIVHICNDVGAWGAGFVMAISQHFGPEPKRYYQRFIRARLNKGHSRLGHLQLVANPRVPKCYVANIIAQKGVVSLGDKIDYQSLERGLEGVAEFCKRNNLTVHMPRIGCGLAGSDWSKIGPRVATLAESCPVVVFDF